ncbi:MAG: hypothetical protein LBE83_06135, partial [Propionibacteriaceae bacterium]|jgi:hypothetical protein|nr:hypothetical protein [Propionibacteriaceae bacterium]
MDTWKAWCRSMKMAGAGMIIVTGEWSAEHLSTGRSVAGNTLIAASEPAPPQTLADVVHLSSPSHASAWQSSILGVSITSYPEALVALEAGCKYVIAPSDDPLLFEGLARLEQTRQLTWFVDGCTTLDDLQRVIGAGAKRVVMKTNDPLEVTTWANTLRQARRSPAPGERVNMGGL